MGYCMYQEDSDFFIKAKDKDGALAAIRALAGKETITDSSGRHFSWVSQGFEKSPTFNTIMGEWRWQVSEDTNGDVVAISFEGEKIGDEETLFKAIAPFVKKGSFIEMRGEDGLMWRWIFDGKTVKEITAKIMWEE